MIIIVMHLLQAAQALMEQADKIAVRFRLL